jgi:hypothetical protein
MPETRACRRAAESAKARDGLAPLLLGRKPNFQQKHYENVVYGHSTLVCESRACESSVDSCTAWAAASWRCHARALLRRRRTSYKLVVKSSAGAGCPQWQHMTRQTRLSS